MKKLVIILTLPLLLAGCVKNGDNVERSKEVMVETGSNYVFKKIYVKDKRGFTHEILTSSSGNTLGGVGMLELCVYKEE
jgi:hypothetical protein